MSNPQDTSKLKRIQYDKNTVIYVLPHVDENKTVEAFKNRDTSANGGLAYLGMLQNSKNRNS